ncbi:DUF1934 domain-containing protein [Limosilactobacillus pontis]|uniref:DUF1934 domain-containing protein n=1 Tax=Limosilactobacillus pontis TaxID=35787 RepID=A0A2J6NLR9_9LACO|nr:DUF1934 domain-containing protein [Limosilactobacillus pontis]PMB82278.1 DUF1934 domain-containing protein [Limosilactobacillus pontis]
MKKRVPVKVSLKTTMEQDGQHETFAFEEDGEFIVLNDKYYLRYYEHQNGQATPVQFRLDDGEVHIHRQGATETWLVFDPEQPTITRYRTEYGVMQLQVVTSRLDRVLDPDTPAGRLFLCYHLQSGGQEIGSYQIELHFTA